VANACWRDARPFRCGVAVWNTTRSLKQSANQEQNRSDRKHAAVRAVLPLALAKISGYAEQSVHGLNDLVGKCDSNGRLPPGTASTSLVESVPSEALETLTEFIEYSDTLDVSIIESTTAWIQIHDSRIRSLIDNNADRRK
jgi:hypothetical protein